MKKIITSFALLTSIAFLGQNTFPTNGNVGIGTTSPFAKFNIVNSNSIGGTNIANSSILLGNTDRGLGIDKNELIVLDNDFYIGTLTQDKDVYLRAGGDTRMFLEGELGNIGIGTTSPNAKLNIVNSSSIGGNNLTNSSLLFGNTIKGLGIDENELAVLDNDFYIGTSTEDKNVYLRAGGSTRMFLNGGSGNIGIGTTNPDSELTVKGKIHCEEVQVDLSVPADYVFEKYYTGVSELKETYIMPTLEEVEAYTKENHHLPSIPSAKEIQEEGLHLKEMTNLLLQKIEELTLYTIEQEKRIKALEGKLTTQE